MKRDFLVNGSQKAEPAAITPAPESSKAVITTAASKAVLSMAKKGVGARSPAERAKAVAARSRTRASSAKTGASSDKTIQARGLVAASDDPEDRTHRDMVDLNTGVYEMTTKLPASYVKNSAKIFIWDDNSANRQNNLHESALMIIRILGSVCLMTKHIRNLVMNHPGFPADLSMHSTPAYRIAETRDKGLGMFATRKLARGDFVLAERPLIFLPRSVQVGANVKWYSEAQVMQIMKYEIEKVFEVAVAQLNDEEKRNLMALHNNHTQDGPILGRQRTNGVSKFPGLRDKGPAATAGFYDAIFKDGARINHSCSPNVVLQWDMASFSMRYCVRRDIEKDEEITISYHSLCQPTSIRQETLDTFGFKCSCAACLHPEISDPRRELISQIEEEHEEDLLNWANGSGKDFAETFSKYSRVFKMCEEEGLEAHPAYAICAGVLAKCYRVLKDEENVAKYLKLQSTALDSDDD